MKSSASILLIVGIGSGALGQYIGPAPYVWTGDSPFNSFAGLYFELENFEDGFNARGVVANGGKVLEAGPETDSVDADDGVIDGVGTRGTSYYSAGENFIAFKFDESVLGRLPDRVGIVATDVGQVVGGNTGYGNFRFRAFDATGNLIGMPGDVTFGDGLVTGETGEDRFLGIIFDPGISMIEVGFVGSTDWEVDHLQYGAVPEPFSAVGLLIGSLLLVRKRRSA